MRSILSILLTLSAFVVASSASHQGFEKRAPVPKFKNGDIGTFELVRKVGAKSLIADGKVVFAWKGSKQDVAKVTLQARLEGKSGGNKVGFVSLTSQTKGRYLGFKKPIDKSLFNLAAFTTSQYPFLLDGQTGVLSVPDYQFAVVDDDTNYQGLIDVFSAKTKLPAKHTQVTIRFVKASSAPTPAPAPSPVGPKFKAGEKGTLVAVRQAPAKGTAQLTDTRGAISWRFSYTDTTGKPLGVSIVTQAGKDSTSPIGLRGFSPNAKSKYVTVSPALAYEARHLSMETSGSGPFTINQNSGELVVPGYYPTLVDDSTSEYEGYVFFFKNGAKAPAKHSKVKLFFRKDV